MNNIPVFLFNSPFLFKVVINCKIIVTNIKMIMEILKFVANTNGLIIAPIPTNKHKFIILDPIIFPNNKSVSLFLADIIPVVISGRDVPIATIVIPINPSDNPIAFAISTELSTTKSAPNFNPSIPKIM